MAEIKSTLDLIMEKTKHLSLDKAEKQDYKTQELLGKVRLAAVRFLNEERNADFVAREIKLLPEEHQEEAKTLCLDLFIERLTPFDDHSRILTGIEKLLDQKAFENWQTTITSLKASARAELEKVKAEALVRARNILAAEGLQGSALEPNVNEDSPFLKQEKEAVVANFQASLKGHKDH